MLDLAIRHGTVVTASDTFAAELHSQSGYEPCCAPFAGEMVVEANT